MNIKIFHGKNVIDSREVAAMIEKKHKNLLADIRGYIEVMEKSTELKIQPSSFFIPTSYKDSTGRELPCYLVTRKGCDMIANKTTGEKGVLFTAAYVTAFEQMEKTLKVPRRPLTEVSPGGMAKLILATRRVMLDMGCSAIEVSAAAKTLFDAYGIPMPVAFTRQIPGQLCMFDRPALEN